MLRTFLFIGICHMLIYPAAAEPYSPSGEYVKDHSIIQARDGTWHLFSISGARGTEWTDSRGEESFSHSVSLDLRDWRFLGHVLGTGGGARWNAGKIWAPHVIRYNGEYWMFHTGVRTGGKHIESIGIAKSGDLREWVEYEHSPVWECPEWGSGHENLRPCRDPMVFRDEKQNRWILYYTTYYDNDSTNHAVGAAVSTDLVHWEDAGTVIRRPSDGPNSLTESCFVIERNSRYYAFLNDGFSVSTDPIEGWSEVTDYASPPGGFAGELIRLDGRWLRSVVVLRGPGDMGLDIFEVRWEDDEISFVPFDGVFPSPPSDKGRGREN